MAYLNPNERVPFFLFVDREHGVDPVASKELGYDVPKLQTFILITPHGHKGDPIEFFADEFIERKGKEAREGRYDHNWVSEFKAGLAMHREGKEIPRHGTPLITWERILKSRREQLVRRFPTIEDLAATPDSSLGEIGLDGRVLRDMAIADLQAKKDLSPVVKELAEANETIRRLQDQIAALTKRMDMMDAEESEKPRRGRPPMNREAA
jgi:uncharacterized coiled-coil protein SlyX